MDTFFALIKFFALICTDIQHSLCYLPTVYIVTYDLKSQRTGVFLHYTYYSLLDRRRGAMIPDEKTETEVSKVGSRFNMKAALATVKFKRLTKRNVLVKGRFQPKYALKNSCFANITCTN